MSMVFLQNSAARASAHRLLVGALLMAAVFGGCSPGVTPTPGQTASAIPAATATPVPAAPRIPVRRSGWGWWMTGPDPRARLEGKP
jgi:hypothetical protein